MEVKGYDKDGQIIATLEGATWTIPNDPANRLRQVLAAWEALGNTIPPYVPPQAPLPDLLKWQLWLAALELPTPITKAKVLAAALADTTMTVAQQETIRIFLEDTSSFVRADPRVDLLASKMGLSPTEMDSLWLWASTFTPAA